MAFSASRVGRKRCDARRPDAEARTLDAVGGCGQGVRIAVSERQLEAVELGPDILEVDVDEVTQILLAQGAQLCQYLRVQHLHS